MPVDSTMGSKHAKGSHKVAAPKRPGPTPAQPPKRQRKADAQAARVEKMNNHNERKKIDKLILGDLKSKDPDVWARLQQSVVNARGRSRGFHENCLREWSSESGAAPVPWRADISTETRPNGWDHRPLCWPCTRAEAWPVTPGGHWKRGCARQAGSIEQRGRPARRRDSGVEFWEEEFCPQTDRGTCGRRAKFGYM